MNKIIFLALAIFVTSSGVFSQTKAGKVDITKHAIFYTCPKHSDVTSNQPGKCPKCGMELNLSNKEQMNAGISKNYACPVHISQVSHNPGQCPKCGKKLSLSGKEQMKAEVMKIYTCPMHPDVALDKEGNCPKCGMVLVERKRNR